MNLTVGHVKYGDKMMVGYRYWTTTGTHPLFAFGFGLSYTSFTFSKLKAPSLVVRGWKPRSALTVANTGKVAGAEVAQLYVSDPSAKAERPERELKGFAKGQLAPGESKHVTLSLDGVPSVTGTKAHTSGAVDPGKFVIRVGDSSENTGLTADITLN